ncbi:MAG TPA: 6-hydroxymethylpterin diphosphokinase MptE-like protein [Anaerolineales bacterium]|nr:6-hydroxymethylpterin diphosphokinase MptE-like protein [Anaerolineales bacterium]
MSQLQRFKDRAPKPLRRMASRLRYGLRHAAYWPAATFHPWRQASIRQLAALKDIHRGQRAFIIGNGPSLKQTDLSRLKSEFTFGMNRFYMLFPELGFNTSYFLTVNSLVIEQCAQDIRCLPLPKFLSWRSRSLIQPTPDTIFLHTTYAGPKFATDARGRLWEGATVTYVALQLAFHMGFEQVILIGVDHSFVTQGQPNTTVVSQGNDPNHFHANYFGKGFRWQLPDLETSEQAYRMAHLAYQRAGRQVLDATIGGKLTVFPKVGYGSLFEQPITHP